MKATAFYSIGKQTSTIDVCISYRIVELFSEGLYSSPNKAIEELVTNAFDAGATNVHVIVPPDMRERTATIVVADDGVGMDEQGLRRHWRIGAPKDRDAEKAPRRRRQIGKFGIGKLATYVLANRLTHVCKSDGKYYSASMDYRSIPTANGAHAFSIESVRLPLRELAWEEARAIVSDLMGVYEPRCGAIRFFGKGQARSWTLAVMSDLKDFAAHLRIGQLTWVLSTAMPLRDDFILYLNGTQVRPSKAKGKQIKRWVIGKDINELPQPAPDGFQVTRDDSKDKTAMGYHGLTHPELGRVTGYVEVYEDVLTTGKSAALERSHGFFVYIRDRLVNITDEYFGINTNLLKHGVFSRFRASVHIDSLDNELRSSRETVRDGPLLNHARNLLHAIFNHARPAVENYLKEQEIGPRVAERVSQTPSSLARRPIIGLVKAALDGKASPLHIRVSPDLSRQKKNQLITNLQDRERIVADVQLLEIAQDESLAIYDPQEAVLRINALHPFVASFYEEYEKREAKVALTLLAMMEVVTEAYLFEAGINARLVHDLMQKRDEMLRYLVRHAGRRTARMIAQDLTDAVTDKDELEKQLVAAFDAMGFDAIHLGGPKKPDGRAHAHLPARDGQERHYLVSLEAKSKKSPGAKVSAKDVNVSGIARNRDHFSCDHAIVVGPDFPTTIKKGSSLEQEIVKNRESTGRTITCMRVVDLARLVRITPVRRITLDEVRQLFVQCTTPEECAKWVDNISKKKPGKMHYKKVLDAIWALQKDRPFESVEYAALAAALQYTKSLTMAREEVKDLCKAMSRMAPQYVSARDSYVELEQRPDKVIEEIKAVVGEYPEDEKEGLVI
ncbi:MAG: ATP-binding protein [bacterium]|nr:ATP-binding protein [bacterium]